MTPTTSMEFVPRAEFEERLHMFQVAIRTELKQSQDSQDAEWNKGFRAVREDIARAMDSVKDDVRDRADSLEKLFLARLDPVRMIAYGAIVMLAGILTAFLSGLLKVGH